MTENRKLKQLLLDAAREGKAHSDGFQAPFLVEDREDPRELEEGRKEVHERIDGKKLKGALK